MPDPRVGVEPNEESTEPPIKLEISPSGRSTCRITNEKIPKGDPRVVCEAYLGGRITNIYAAVQPFLDGCRVEECSKANSGICRGTRHKFEKGEVRFVGHVGDKKKVFLTLAAAAELLPPLFEAAGGWDPVNLQGVDALDSNQIEEFCTAFKVDRKAAAGLKAKAPAPKDPDEKPPPRKRQKKDAKGAAADTATAEGEEAMEPAAQQPAAKKPAEKQPAAEKPPAKPKQPAAKKLAAKRGAKGAAEDAGADDGEAATKAGKQPAAKKPAARKPAAKRGRRAVKEEEDEAKAAEEEEKEQADEEEDEAKAAEEEEKEQADEEAAEEAEGAAAADAPAEDEVDAKEEDGEELPPGQDVAAEEASPERALLLDALLPGSPKNDYEKARREQIRRNLERMQELNVVGAAAKVAPPKREKPPRARGLPARRRVKEEPGPRRQSLRQQGVAADGTRIDHEKRNGEVVLVNGEAIRCGAVAKSGAWEAPPPRDRHPKAQREVTWSGQSHMPRAPWTSQVGNAAAAALRAVEEARLAAAEEAAQPDAAAKRHPEGPVEFRSSNGGANGDARFVQLLAMQTAAAGGGGKAGSKGKSTQAPGRTQRSELLDISLAEEDVAKVTRDGVVHMAFHPRSDAIILAAGDKGGRLGLWQLDHDAFEMPEQASLASAQASNQPAAGRRSRSHGTAAEDSASAAQPSEAESSAQPMEEAVDGDGGSDGILELQPHYQYISGLRWVGGAGMAARLLTVSYDGSLRCMDPGAGCTCQLLRSEDGAEYSAMDATADGNTAYLADKDGALEVVDTRQAADAKPAAEISLHEKKINTLSLETGDEHLLATGVGDGTVAVWDVRNLAQNVKPVATAGHSYSCQAAFFAPDGSQRIVSTSRDNTLRVWDAKKGLAPGSVMKHNNNTGRWISPFRAVWSPAADAIVVGNMGRQVDIFDDNGAQAGAHSSDLMTAIPSRCTVHTSLPLLAAATASGRVHVYR